MVLQGRITIENTGATQPGIGIEPGRGKTPVRFGDTVVPASVAYLIDGEGGSPSLRAEFEIRDGQPICTSVTVTASDDGRGVSTGDLASIPNLARLTEDAFLALALRVEDRPQDWRLDPADRARTRLARGDIRTRGDEELRAVAEVYRDNLADRPVEAVEAMGYTRRTAGRRIQQARDKGFLPPTTRGRKRA